MKNNNLASSTNRNNNNYNFNPQRNHNDQYGTKHDDRRQSNQSQKLSQHHHHQQQQQQSMQQHYPQQQQQQYHNQQPQQFQGQRDRSGQRSQIGQYPDTSIQGNQANWGCVRFAPGASTKELPFIETRADANKKFTGRCRLFVGNLPHSATEEKLRGLFEKFGEISECYLGPKSAYAFIKMDTRQNAEAARDALDCSMYDGRTLRVRLAAHAAAIRVKHLSPHVTNELLAYAFRYFGEIERAVVIVDDKGKSVCEGFVEYSRKQSALYAMKRCQQECFMLTASPKPVLVEPFDQQDEDEGLPEKSINKNSNEFKEQREVGPRFAEQGTFEHTFGLKWKELYEVERQKRERLEQEIQEARKNLQDQFEYSRLEHDTMQLRSRLQQLEDNRMKLQQLKEQTKSLTNAQQRDEERGGEDLLIRQREDELFRLQQLGGPNGLNQQENSLRVQATGLLSGHEQDQLTDTNVHRQTPQQSGSQIGHQTDSAMSMNMMAPQMPDQPRTFADAAAMAMTQPPFIPVQQMAMHPALLNPQMHQPNIFTAYIPPPQIAMPMQIHLDEQNDFVNPPAGPGYLMSSQQLPQAASGGSGRHQKFNRQHNNNNNNQGNNAMQSRNGGGGGGRPRKRGRF